MFSLGAMIYLIARAVPRVSDIREDFERTPYAKIDKLISFLPLERLDVTLSTQLEKALRKIKLILMKWDNLVTHHLKKVKKTNGNGEKPALFDNIEEQSETDKTPEN